MIETSLARFVVAGIAVLDAIGTTWFFSSLGFLGPVGALLSVLGFGYGIVAVKYREDRRHKVYVALLWLAVVCSCAFIVNELMLSNINWLVIGVRTLQVYCFVSLIAGSARPHDMQSSDV